MIFNFISFTIRKTSIYQSMVEVLEIIGGQATAMVNDYLMKYLTSLIVKLKAVKI